jgi:hypothetical protein
MLFAFAVLWPAVAAAQTGDAMPVKGKVALLPNDRIMEGDIERVGDQYRIRRASGETWLCIDKVRRLCDSMEEAYAYLRTQAKLNEPDERLRLARWCMSNGLRQQALAEATAALEIRPKDVESQRMVKGLQRSLATSSSTTPTEAKEEAIIEPTYPTPLPYNTGSLGLFVTKVQPILMNACASCHASGKGGSFKLLRVYADGSAGNSRTTQYNLMSTLAHLDRRDPSQSELLNKATIIHSSGAEQPPIRDRKAPAFRTLEEWTNLALADLPKPPPAVVAAKPPVAVVEATPPTKPEPTPETKPTEEPTTSTSQFASPPPPEDTPAAKPNEPTDEFDPIIFNKQMHGGK